MGAGTEIEFRFDFSLVRESNLRNREGMTASQLGRALGRAARAARHLRGLQEAGQIGFPDLPFREREARSVARFAARCRRRFTHLLLLGIGGSALGARAVHEGLGGGKGRKGLRLSIADNVALQDQDWIQDFEAESQPLPDVGYCIRLACPSPVVWHERPVVILASSHPSRNSYWADSVFLDLFGNGRAFEPGGYCTVDGELAAAYQG